MIYQFKNKKTGQIKDVYMSMSDYKPFCGENGDEDGQWERIYYAPQLNTVGTRIDPYNSKHFVDKTGRMKGTYGDLLDYSAELSEKRASKDGEDPLKRKYFEEYKKKRGGKKHLKDVPKKIETKNYKIEF
jgi:hypothetical protein